MASARSVNNTDERTSFHALEQIANLCALALTDDSRHNLREAVNRCNDIACTELVRLGARTAPDTNPG